MTTAVPTGSIEGDHSVENDIVDISVHEEMNVNLHEIASRPVVKPILNLEAVRKRYSQIASYQGHDHESIIYTPNDIERILRDHISIK